MRGILLAFIFSFNSVAFANEDCGTHLGPEIIKAEDRLNELNPNFLSSSHLSNKELLLILSEEIWRLLPLGMIPWKDKPLLPEELLIHLKQQFSKAFRTEEMNEDALYLFYTNQLRSIFFLALREWMEEELDRIPLEGKPLKNYGLSLMSRKFGPSVLITQTLAPQRVKQILESDEWLHYPWEKVTPEEIEKAPGFQNPCCLTEGCLLCPNNRKWLRKKPTS